MTNLTFLTIWLDWIPRVDLEHHTGAHAHAIPVSWHNMERFAILQMTQYWLYAERPSWWKRLKFYCVMSVPTLHILTYWLNSAVYDRAGAGLIGYVSAFESVTMLLVPFIQAVDESIVGSTGLTHRYINATL